MISASSTRIFSTGLSVRPVSHQVSAARSAITAGTATKSSRDRIETGLVTSSRLMPTINVIARGPELIWRTSTRNASVRPGTLTTVRSPGFNDVMTAAPRRFVDAPTTDPA